MQLSLLLSRTQLSSLCLKNQVRKSKLTRRTPLLGTPLSWGYLPILIGFLLLAWPTGPGNILQDQETNITPSYGIQSGNPIQEIYSIGPSQESQHILLVHARKYLLRIPATLSSLGSLSVKPGNMLSGNQVSPLFSWFTTCHETSPLDQLVLQAISSRKPAPSPLLDHWLSSQAALTYKWHLIHCKAAHCTCRFQLTLVCEYFCNLCILKRWTALHHLLYVSLVVRSGNAR